MTVLVGAYAAVENHPIQRRNVLLLPAWDRVRPLRTRGIPRHGYLITMTEPGGQEHVESFPSSDAAHTRWVKLQERFVADGWRGPHGRE